MNRAGLAVANEGSSGIHRGLLGEGGKAGVGLLDSPLGLGDAGGLLGGAGGCEHRLPLGFQPGPLVACCRRALAIHEVSASPAGRRLDRTGRRHLTAERQVGRRLVFGGPAQCFEFGEGKDVVVGPRGQTGGGDSHVAGGAIEGMPHGRHTRVVDVGILARGDERDALEKLSIVADFHPIPQREAEAGTDVVEGVVAGPQHDLAQRQRPAQVDLHPCLGVRSGGDVTVPAVGGARIGLTDRQRLDRRSECNEPLASRGSDRLFEGLLAAGMRHLLLRELPPLRGHVWVGVKANVVAVDGGKHGLQRVVVFLADRVELVGMALGALHGDAGKAADRIGHHVVAVEMTGNLAVGLRFRNLAMANEVPGACGDETDRLVAVAGVAKEHIASDLFFNEAGVGLVVVETPDHVVAVGPGVGAELVFVVAMGVAVVDDVEPVAGPPFAVPRGSEQTVDQLLVGIGSGVTHKSVDFLSRGRQAGEIKREPPDQHAAIGSW